MPKECIIIIDSEHLQQFHWRLTCTHSTSSLSLSLSLSFSLSLSLFLSLSHSLSLFLSLSLSLSLPIWEIVEHTHFIDCRQYSPWLKRFDLVTMLYWIRAVTETGTGKLLGEEGEKFQRLGILTERVMQEKKRRISKSYLSTSNKRLKDRENNKKGRDYKRQNSGRQAVWTI